MENDFKTVLCNWIPTSLKMPEIPKDTPMYDQKIKVIACWGSDPNQMAEMDYARKIIRGKEIHRFEWFGRISPWVILYWMYLPESPFKNL